MDNASTIYAWEGINRKGRRVSGQTVGHNPALIKAQLRQQGICPERVRQRSPCFSRPRPTDQIRRHRPLHPTVGNAAESRNCAAASPRHPQQKAAKTGACRRWYKSLKQEIAAGSNLATALRKQPRHFDALYCNLIAAGEQAGALETLLERVALHLEKTQQLKARIKKAMTYPVTVLVVASVVSTLLLVHVVPQFQTLFAGSGGKLPGFTQVVIALSEFLRNAWWLLALGLGTAVAGLRRAYRVSPGFSPPAASRFVESAPGRHTVEKVRRRPLRSHTLDYVQCRRPPGAGIGLGRLRRRQWAIQTSHRAPARRCIHRYSVESIHDHQRPVSSHGDPDDRYRRRVRHAGPACWKRWQTTMRLTWTRWSTTSPA